MFQMLISGFLQVSEVQMHESRSEPAGHTVQANPGENRHNHENEGRLKSGQTPPPPPEAPRVSHFFVCIRLLINKVRPAYRDELFQCTCLSGRVRLNRFGSFKCLIVRLHACMNACG